MPFGVDWRVIVEVALGILLATAVSRAVKWIANHFF